MTYNLSTAAMATGASKSTILRAIKAGRLSATKDEVGWQIEVAELHRVFKPLPIADAPTDPAVTNRATQDELVKLLQTQIDDMRQERDRWHDSADQWRTAFEEASSRLTRLLPPPDAPRNGGGARWQRAWRWMRKTG
jgi:hypothetical protein